MVIFRKAFKQKNFNKIKNLTCRILKSYFTVTNKDFFSIY